MSSATARTAVFRSLAFAEGGLLQVIRGKYKLRILWNLQDGSLRFGALRKELAKGSVSPKLIAPRVLSRELKSLVDLGLIHRRSYNVVPPRVEYRLTALGYTVLPVISAILEWRSKHLLRRSAPRELGLRPRPCEVETTGMRLQ
jgi:DNA-binding HxlR family transcriptional regulator